jgi:hypothetical protein
VVAALARALQLTDTEPDHLYRLAGLVPPVYGEISEHIAPSVRRVLGDPLSVPPALRNFARDSSRSMATARTCRSGR